jgi:hypothetical protein
MVDQTGEQWRALLKTVMNLIIIIIIIMFMKG